MDVALDRPALLIDFTEANMQTYHLVEPCGDTIRPPYEPPGDREPYDPTIDAHWRRLLPRIPTTPELTRFDRDVQYETIRVLVQMLRVLRVTAKTPRKMRTACRELMGELATVAEELFGANSLPALEARAAHLTAIASDLRYRKVRGFDTPYESTLDAGQALFELYEEVRDRYCDVMAPGAWLEFIDKVSGRIDALRRRDRRCGQCRGRPGDPAAVVRGLGGGVHPARHRPAHPATARAQGALPWPGAPAAHLGGAGASDD